MSATYRRFKTDSAACSWFSVGRPHDIYFKNNFVCLQARIPEHARYRD